MKFEIDYSTFLFHRFCIIRGGHAEFHWDFHNPWVAKTHSNCLFSM